jgi:transposase InsO family protein
MITTPRPTRQVVPNPTREVVRRHTSGSEGGPGKPTSRKADRAPRSDPYTYCRSFAGWVYPSFVTDVFSRRVVGWQLSTSLRADLALDALNMGLWTRQRAGHDTSALVHHSDRGVQYVAVRYTERLAEAGAVASVGSKGDSYDNAMAEAFNSLFKAELVRNLGPWKGIDDLEIAVAEYVDWFNFRRLHGEIGLVPPAEYETQHQSTTLPEQPAQREFHASIEPGT